MNERNGAGGLLTVPQVAERLHISTWTCRKMIREEGLPATRLGRRRVRVPADALDAWLAARTTGATGGAVPAPGGGDAVAAASEATAPAAAVFDDGGAGVMQMVGGMRRGPHGELIFGR